MRTVSKIRTLTAHPDTSKNAPELVKSAITVSG